MQKRFKLLACKVLFREVSYLSAKCGNYIDATFLRQGLHDTPTILAETLQDEIDRIDGGEDMQTYRNKYGLHDFDAILLGYGLCSNGITGLSSQKYPIVVPKAHDCITIFLGSKDKYQELFDQAGGTFWYSASWIENADLPSLETEQALLKVYTDLYGEENAQYLLDTQLTANYERAAYVDWDALRFPEYEEFARRAAEYYGWEYKKVEGDDRLLSAMLNGDWNEEDFLIVPPGKKIVADCLGSGIITYE